MKTIWKYEIPTIGEAFALRMPGYPGMLTVQMQHGKPKLWALVDTDLPTRLQRFCLLGAGNPLPDNEWLEYVGTFQTDGGLSVGHVFYYREEGRL